MNKYIKKTLVLSLISSVLAMNAGIAFANEDKYSIFELEQLLVKNNSSLISLNEEVERAERNYNNAKTISAAVNPNLYEEEGYDKYNLKLKEELNPLTTLDSYKDIFYSYESKKSDLLNQLRLKFHEYINLKDSFENDKTSFESLKKEYLSKEKQLELGLITDTDFSKFKKEYNTQYFSVYSSDLTIKNLQREILALVGKDVFGSLDVERSSFSSESYKIDDLDDLISNTVLNSYEIENLIDEKTIAEKELEFKSRFAGFSNTKLEVENLNFKIDDYKRQIDDKKRSLEYKVRTDYNNILIEEENLKISKLSLEIAEDEYKIDQVKYENGLLSEINYKKSLDKLKSAASTYNKGRLTYFDKVSTFKSWIELQVMELNK